MSRGKQKISKSVVAVAQLVESRIVIPVVVGSSPISHPKESNKKPNFYELGFLFSGWYSGYVTPNPLS